MKSAVGMGVILALFMAFTAAAAVRVDKDSIKITSQKDTATIGLTRENGQPIAAKDIRSVELMASGHNYSHMINVQKQAGKIVVSPKNLESGTYTLVINTSSGLQRVQVDASGIPGYAERLAAERGVPEEVVKRELGMTTESPRSSYSIDLPDNYYEGQMLDVTLPGDPQATYRWMIDGKIVKQGEGAMSFQHVWKEPGDHVLTVMEIKNGVVVGSGTDTTTVRPQPAMAWTIPSNTEVKLQGPDGYDNYAWLVNGNLVSTDKNLDFRIKEPGDYLLEVIATEPHSGNVREFNRMAWRTTVTQPERYMVARRHNIP